MHQIGTPSSPQNPNLENYQEPSGAYYSVNFVQIWREKRVTGFEYEQIDPTCTEKCALKKCGNTMEEVRK